MALQDLTPQLRTRLSRMERAVGWFVMFATALLLVGFAYYVYAIGQRKGWFHDRAPFYIYVETAAGLKVGDPVYLMGFPAGEITKVKPMPADYFEHNVYVEFDIVRGDNIGYLWTVGSRARVVPANFLGSRQVEVTRGTGGYASFQYYPLQELSRDEAQALPEPAKWLLAQDIYAPNPTNGLDLIYPALKPLDNLPAIFATGVTQIWALDTRQQLKTISAVWDDQEGHYRHFHKHEARPYFLVVEETPAVTDQAQALLGTIKQALPGITNQIPIVLSNITMVMSNINVAAATAQPALANFSLLAEKLRGPNALGEMLLGTNGVTQVGVTLEKAQNLITTVDTNFPTVMSNLNHTLSNLTRLSGNLSSHMESDTNVLGEFSQTAAELDRFLEGLQRHWLFRSAFKPAKTNAAAPPKKK